MMKYFLCPILWLLLSAKALAAAVTQPVPLSITSVRSIPHSENTFTQGLVLYQNDIIESGGRYGQSFIRRYKISNNEKTNTLWQENLNAEYFAEGLTVFDKKLYLLTWKSHTVFVFDLSTHKLLSTHPYTGEGWGLTHNGFELIRSDGSSRLYFHDAKTFKLIRTLEIHEQGRRVTQINELEYANGLIWANLWHQDRIIAIDPKTGAVIAYADLSELVAQQHLTDPSAVLNGIAYDHKNKGFWLTGKLWHTLYFVQFKWPSTH